MSAKAWDRRRVNKRKRMRERRIAKVFGADVAHILRTPYVGSYQLGQEQADRWWLQMQAYLSVSVMRPEDFVNPRRTP